MAKHPVCLWRRVPIDLRTFEGHLNGGLLCVLFNTKDAPACTGFTGAHSEGRRVGELLEDLTTKIGYCLYLFDVHFHVKPL